MKTLLCLFFIAFSSQSFADGLVYRINCEEQTLIESYRTITFNLKADSSNIFIEKRWIGDIQESSAFTINTLDRDSKGNVTVEADEFSLIESYRKLKLKIKASGEATGSLQDYWINKPNGKKENFGSLKCSVGVMIQG